MSEASKALAEVRGWLCDNLDASDAGHVCGMLSVVSRRVVQADELESDNTKLRAARDAAVEDAKSIIVMLSNARAENARLRSELESVGTAAYLYGRSDLKAKNAKLQELVESLLQCHVEDADTCARCAFRSPLHGGCMADVTADELGIEVSQ